MGKGEEGGVGEEEEKKIVENKKWEGRTKSESEGEIVGEIVGE